MARTTFIPAQDANLLNWAASASGFITATPTDYALTATIATAFAAAVSAYSDALANVKPGVRSGMYVAAKNTAKAALIANIRAWAKIVYAAPAVTDAQRKQLGLNVKAMPTPIPAPLDAPALDIVSVTGRTVKIRLHNSDKTKRGRPPGVKGAAVFSFIGAVAPADPSAWKFEGNTSKTLMNVAFDPSVAGGTQVWFTAFWYNPRSMSGPGCEGVGTFLQGGSASVSEKKAA